MPQSLSCIIVHIVFSTSGRRRYINSIIREELFSYIGGICNNSGCPVLKVGGFDDHVHVACYLSRTLPIASLTESIKKNSSKWIKTQGESLGNFSWQKGYSVFSVGRSQVADLVRYIETQEKHHKRFSFQDELRNFLLRYQVDYDEKYLWD